MPCIQKVQMKKKLPESNITARQMEFMAAFRSLVKRNRGVAPSLEELAAEMGVKKATAQTFVRRLLANGYLERRSGSYRSLSEVAR
jgi:DNA-binding MarR family transcriptional regulator